MTSVAEEIDFATRVSELFARLLCHQLQPGLRTRSSVYLLDAHRRCIVSRLKRLPALAETLADPCWLEIAWCDAVAIAAERTYTVDFPAACPWAMAQIIEPGWAPSEPDKQRAFAAGLTDLLVDLLRWQLFPALRTPGGRYSLDAQRRRLRTRIEADAEFAAASVDPAWLAAIWQQARAAAPGASADLPENCPWPLAQILEIGWFPD